MWQSYSLRRALPYNVLTSCPATDYSFVAKLRRSRSSAPIRLFTRPHAYRHQHQALQNSRDNCLYGQSLYVRAANLNSLRSHVSICLPRKAKMTAKKKTDGTITRRPVHSRKYLTAQKNAENGRRKRCKIE